LAAVKIRWAELQVECANALLEVGNSERVETKCKEIIVAAAESGLTSTQAYAHFVRTYHYAVIGDVPNLIASRQKLRGIVKGAEFAYLCEITDFWLGDNAPGDQLVHADWIDGVDATRARWISVVENRRQTLNGE